MFRSGEDFVLGGFVERHERGAVAGDADHDVAVVFRLGAGGEQFLATLEGELTLLAASAEVALDQRGHVAESLWGDPAWNPQMSVAVDASDSRWRLEAAIPMSDLVKTPPKQKSVWAVSMTRTMPQVGWQSWVTPVTGRPSPTQFGLVRFR